MSYSWDYSIVLNNLDVLFRGVWVTLGLTLTTVVLGFLLGALITLLRTSKISALKWAARIYIEIFRDLPVLVVLIWLYYCMPIFLGPNLRISSFWVGVLGLGLNFSALQAEILRSGYEAIPNGELEAARVLGFSRGQILKHIIIPQALWRSIAPTLGQAINTLKLTSLASFIVVREVFYQTTFLIQETYRPLELYTTLAVLYLIIIVPLAVVTQLLEGRLSRRFRYG